MDNKSRRAKQKHSSSTNNSAQYLEKIRPSPPSDITRQHSRMEEFNISTVGVEKLLKKLKEHKALGPDDLTPKLLLSVATEVSPILRFIFCLSLRQGVIPADWSHARLSPIFKNGDTTKAEKYRTVSLASIPYKIMVHIMSSQINRHLEKFNIFNDSQRGFRKRRSCESQLISTIGDFIQSIEDGSQCDTILLNFSKAFDRVSHNLLLTKLKHYGIDGRIHQWIESFPSNSSQEVAVKGVSSEKNKVTSGYPRAVFWAPSSLSMTCSLTSSTSTYVS